MVDAEHHENGRCLHCGGAVDEAGMALGGEVGTGEHELPPEVDGDTSPQLSETERLRDFASAVGGRR